MTLLEAPEASTLYDADRQRLGYVANYTRVFALGPVVYAAWNQLATAVRAGMDERRYEPVTLAAARRLRSPYCTLAHAAPDDIYNALDAALGAALLEPTDGGHHDE